MGFASGHGCFLRRGGAADPTDPGRSGQPVVVGGVGPRGVWPKRGPRLRGTLGDADVSGPAAVSVGGGVAATVAGVPDSQLTTGAHTSPSSHVNDVEIPHACPSLTSGNHASCGHTATTDGDYPALTAAPDDSRRRHRQHRLPPPRRLDSSDTTGEVRPGDEADAMSEATMPPWQAARLTVLLERCWCPALRRRTPVCDVVGRVRGAHYGEHRRRDHPRPDDR
ncbi:MAG: hypothetical protein QOI03_1359 [Solirubrobacteraceae bacterium]|nr:hypothetical protein [Solirubrobacteraceae bacterium]